MRVILEKINVQVLAVEPVGGTGALEVGGGAAAVGGVSAGGVTVVTQFASVAH